MPVTDISKDIDNLTLTITAEFTAPVERVWQIYADPRQLEKIWGPPGFPATVVDHALRPGGTVTYFMTGPDGEKYGGWWKVTAVDEPRSFAFDDGFADEDLKPAADMPVSHNVYTFEPVGDGATRVTYVSRYESAEGLQQVLEMGVEEGSREAINQIDALLAG
ncbi:SRPBCC domain-containing protein [[Mycobacterium] wendilense]|uniref:SRPBCC domain-containing protein n=1 Tax=[Mycobacterium] wendilense TaxID=3064284 RepID=A0ABN9PCU5_9MYCO|nr:SRPBCC domain-containing protein [Mycolicibacterium sp. MU0050]CAJ1587538.1 SRPBCC domain-containing protein [Mycolicibacterium sp. MU0050]